MYARIKQHGENLLSIFPNATERDPIKLCKKLRRLEAAASRRALVQCNGGPDYLEEETCEAAYDVILARVAKLLYLDGDDGHSPAVFINRDPRGYALKIRETTMREAFAGVPLHRDWGGYGIIAPDLTEE
jgi:hypothetical protein